LERLDNSVLVIGNGESRKHLDLSQFKGKIHTIGCNALHRDFTPDRLICCDRRMVDESLKNPSTKQIEIYVRKDWFHFFRKIKKNKNIKLVPELPYQGTDQRDDPFNWGSGGYAVLIAAAEFQNIYLLGFDLYPNRFLKVNNIYKSTENYNAADSRPVDPSYWTYQIAKIFSLFKDKNFYVINEKDWARPPAWIKSNVDFLEIDQFKI
jgi:hypothetical protein